MDAIGNSRIACYVPGACRLRQRTAMVQDAAGIVGFARSAVEINDAVRKRAAEGTSARGSGRIARQSAVVQDAR